MTMRHCFMNAFNVMKCTLDRARGFHSNIGACSALITEWVSCDHVNFVLEILAKNVSQQVVVLTEDLYKEKLSSHHISYGDFVHRRGRSIQIITIREINAWGSVCNYKCTRAHRIFFIQVRVNDISVSYRSSCYELKAAPQFDAS